MSAIKHLVLRAQFVRYKAVIVHISRRAKKNHLITDDSLVYGSMWMSK